MSLSLHPGLLQLKTTLGQTLGSVRRLFLRNLCERRNGITLFNLFETQYVK